MSYLLNIILSVAVSIASVIGVYNYAPLSQIELTSPASKRLGATITTIAGSDTISSSRTTINNNFTNLNSGKIENSTTSVDAITTLSNLATVGTVTSGTWSATTVAGNKGGTGTTSPSIYQVLLGNGTAGVTIASSTGSSGQFLTSNGGGAYPNWTSPSVDQTINYNWSGATTTFSGGVVSVTNIASTTWGLFGIGRGAANTYTVQLDPYQSSYNLGLSLLLQPSATNTGASTLNVNGLGTKNIKGKWGTNPLPGDIRPGVLSRLVYDGANFQLLNPQQARIEPASTTPANIVIDGTCPNTSWSTLYLGHITGTTTSMVVLHARIGGTGGGPNATFMAFRPLGETASTTGGTGYIGNENPNSASLDGYAMLRTDGEGAIQWRCGVIDGTNSFNLTVDSFWNL